VTGAGGYLGANLVQALTDVDCTIVRLGRNVEGSVQSEGAARIVDLAGDVRRPDIWEDATANVDVVYHLAAQTSVYVADQDPAADLDSNVRSMLYLLEACRTKGARPVVLFSGTTTQLGIPTHLPVDETQPDNPITIYDLHKLIAEQYLKYYTSQGVVRGVSLRLANVYGPGLAARSSDRGVLNMMVRKALEGEALTVYGDGNYLRDYVYVDDVVAAFLVAAVKIDSVNGRHFVIGSGQGHTVAQAFEMVAERVALNTARRVPVVHVESPAGQSAIEERNFVANSSGFAEATGWTPGCSLSEGIDATIRAFSSGEPRRGAVETHRSGPR